MEADDLGDVDGSGDDQLVLLDDVVAQLEFDELATQLLDGPVRRRSIVARTGSTASATSSDIGTPWSIQVEAVWAADAVGATQAASLGELGGAVAAVNATGTELSVYPTDWSPDGLDGFDFARPQFHFLIRYRRILVRLLHLDGVGHAQHR